MIFDAINSFFVMMIAIVIIGIIIRGIWLLTGAWGLNKLADAAESAEPSYVGRIRSSETVSGVVTQIREIRPGIAGTASRRDYQLAVAYPRGNEQLTALFGLITEEPLAMQEGNRVKLHIFAAPLMQPNAEAWQRARLAAGCLPKESVHYRDFQGIPMDETATVMFEEDFLRYKQLSENEYLATDHKTLPNTLRIAAAGFAALGLLIFLMLLLEI